MSPVTALTEVPPHHSQTACTALVDEGGTLHVVWQVTGPGLSQLHYQARPATGDPSPEDVLVESRGELIQNANLMMDEDGGLDLVFDHANPLGSQVCYKHWQADGGWDAVSTELTMPDWGTSIRPQALPAAAGNLDVLYVSYGDNGARLMLRTRDMGSIPPLSVPPVAAPRASRLAVSPNPLRAGNAVGLSWSGSGSLAVRIADVYDVAGRRIAEVRLSAGQDGRWTGRIEGASTGRWVDGVYFARLRDERAGSARLVVLR
jgi:hypothetical protein